MALKFGFSNWEVILVTTIRLVIKFCNYVKIILWSNLEGCNKMWFLLNVLKLRFDQLSSSSSSVAS